MVIINNPYKKSTKNKCWTQCGEKGTFLHCRWECKLMQPLWRTAWRFLKILKVELPYDSAIPFLGAYLEETIVQKDTCTRASLSLLTIAMTWEQHKHPSIEKWIKMWHIYTKEYYTQPLKRMK